MQEYEKAGMRSFFASRGPLWVGMLLFFLIGVRWLWRYRAGQPLDIDEAGYLSFSLLDYHGLIHNGLAGYWSAFEASSVQAPLTAALATLIYCVTGPEWIFGFGVPLLAGVGIIAASYALGCALGSHRVAGISALLVGSCPVIINYSRSFHFSLPATLVITVAFVALLRSNRCRHFGWALLFGFCLGLMPLARTMTIAFIPGIAIGALVYVVIDREALGRRGLTLFCSFLLAALVTGLWLFPNRHDVFGYLLNYGYGSHAVEYGPTAARFGWNAWLTQARVFLGYIYLPHAAFALVGALALLFLFVRRLIIKGPGAAASILASNVTPIVIFIAEAVVALTSTQNKGSAFMAPFVPAALVVAVWTFERCCSARYCRYAITSIAVVVALLGFVPSISLNLARVRTVNLPIIGSADLTDGLGTIQRYEAEGGYRSDNPDRPIKTLEGHAWIDISRTSALRLAKYGSARTRTAFGFLHFLYNTNTVGLEQWASDGIWTAFAAIDPLEAGDTVEGDVNWLTHGSAADACLLLTSNDYIGHIHPLANQTSMTEAAKQIGFETIDNWALPDGQKVTLWRRNSQELHCSDIAPH